VDIWKENLNSFSKSRACDLSTTATTSQNGSNENGEKYCTDIRFIQESTALLKVAYVKLLSIHYEVNFLKDQK
jgi:uncharacterized protein (DUF2237 family)